MKLSLSTALLLCATASAYPLRDVDGATPPALSTDNRPPPAQPSQWSESVNGYLARLHQGASALFAESSLDTKPTPSASASTPEPTHDDARHEALMASFGQLDQRFKDLANKAHPGKDPVVSSDPEAEYRSTSRRKAYHKILMESFSKLDLRYKELADKANPKKRAIPASDPEIEPSSLGDVIARHGLACIALVIFILAPISFLFFYAIGLLFARLTQERSPHRGPGAVCLDGPEKDARALSNQEREAVTTEKSWQEQC